MVAVDVPLMLSSTVAKLMVEFSEMVYPGAGRIVVVGASRSTYPELVELFPMFPTLSWIRQLSVNCVVFPLLRGGIKDGTEFG